MKSLKKLWGVLMALSLMAGLTACGDDDLGFPETLRFGKDGGTVTVHGASSLIYFDIVGYDGNTVDGEESVGDSVFVSYQWLSVKSKKFTSELIITAAPMETGKERTLCIGVCDGPDSQDIKVVQK